MKVVDITEKAVKAKIEEMGYSLYTVEYEKEFGQMTLTVIIEKEGGAITLDDCEAVSNAIDPLIEQADPTAGKPYNFTVSSVGLTRPLKIEKDWARALGKRIEVNLFAPIEKKKYFMGTLKEYSDDSVILEIEDNKHKRELKLEKTAIATARPYVTFEEVKNDK